MRNNQSTLTSEQHHDLNYGVKYEVQQQAAARLKRAGVKVKEVPVVLWLVDGEYLTPRTMVDREEKGYYGNKEANESVKNKIMEATQSGESKDLRQNKVRKAKKGPSKIQKASFKEQGAILQKRVRHNDRRTKTTKKNSDGKTKQERRQL